jgi:hypothetical protein
MCNYSVAQIILEISFGEICHPIKKKALSGERAHTDFPFTISGNSAYGKKDGGNRASHSKAGSTHMLEGRPDRKMVQVPDDNKHHLDAHNHSPHDSHIRHVPHNHHNICHVPNDHHSMAPQNC